MNTPPDLSSLAEACAKEKEALRQVIATGMCAFIDSGHCVIDFTGQRLALCDAILESVSHHLQPLAKDRERLDWLDTKAMGRNPTAWSVFEYADNIRQAIDANMPTPKPASSS